jgi:hypothetical protein
MKGTLWPTTSLPRQGVIIVCAVVMAAVGGLVTWLVTRPVTRPVTLPHASCGRAWTHLLDSSNHFLGAEPGALGCFSTAARRCSSASIAVTEWGIDTGTNYVFVIASGRPLCKVTELSRDYGLVKGLSPVTSVACRLTAVASEGVMLNCGGQGLLIPATVSINNRPVPP